MEIAGVCMFLRQDGIFTGMFSSYNDLLNFIKTRSNIIYAFCIPCIGHFAGLWLFSGNLPDILRAIINFNWESYINNKEENDYYNYMHEYANSIRSRIDQLKIQSNENETNFFHSLADFLFHNHPRLFDLIEYPNEFYNHIKEMREIEETDDDDYSEEYAEHKAYEEARCFENKLKSIASSMAARLSKEYIFNISFLEKIIFDNEDIFREHNLFGQKMKYISLIGEKAACDAIVHYGTENKIADKDFFNQKENYSSLITLYRNFLPISVIRGWTHMINTLSSIKKKLVGMDRKKQLEIYIENQKIKLSEYEINYAAKCATI